MRDNRLPYYYNDIVEIEQLFNVFDNNITIKNQILKQLSDEFFIQTASYKGINIYAKTLDTYPSKIDVWAKLGPQGIITKNRFKNLVDRILGHDISVTITELSDRYIIYIGINENIENIEKERDRIYNFLRFYIPSHLDLRLYFNVLIWDIYDKQDLTWNDWDAKNLTWDEFEVWHE